MRTAIFVSSMLIAHALRPDMDMPDGLIKLFGMMCVAFILMDIVDFIRE